MTNKAPLPFSTKEEIVFFSLSFFLALGGLGVWGASTFLGRAFFSLEPVSRNLLFSFSLFCPALGAALCLGRRTAFFFLFLVFLLTGGFIFIGGLHQDYFLFCLMAALWGLLLLRGLSRFSWLYGAASGFLILASGAVIGLSVYERFSSKSLSSAQIELFLETNFKEAIGYMNLHPALWAPWLVMPLLAIGFYLMRRVFQKERPFSLEAAALSFLFLSLGLYMLPLSEKLLFSYSAIANYDRRAFLYRDSLPKRLESLSSLGAFRTKDAPRGPIIVVIGESANRNHLHLYGYERPTTPYLESLSSSELVVFRDVIASYPGTSPSLTKALTTVSVGDGKNYYDPGEFSLVELLRGAGVWTAWISNQAKHGLWGQPITDIAFASNELWFSQEDKRNSRLDSLLDTSLSVRRLPDGLLLKKVEETLKKQKGPSVLILHLMGSHWPYSLRYPFDFERFNAGKEGKPPLGGKGSWAYVDSYDNSILYTDFFLKELTRKLESTKSEAALLYFSDHGESPFLGTTHNPSLFSVGDVEIPFLLWFSKAYRARRPEIVRQAQSHATAPFMLDRVLDTILDLAGVRGPFYKPDGSLLNAAFRPVRRMTLDGQWDYDAAQEDYCDATFKETGYQLTGTCWSKTRVTGGSSRP